MKWIIGLFCLLILCNGVCGLDEFYDIQNLRISSDIKTDITFEKENNWFLEYATANLGYYPRETEYQEIVQLELSPEAELEDGLYVFNLDKNKDVNKIAVSSTIDVQMGHQRITDKVWFPIANVPEEVQQYLEPTEYITSGEDEIITLASEIVAGEEDLYFAVFKIAQWVQENIEYSLDTLSEKGSQNAKWVLENRYGVCDEITTLFAALARAVGIPVKFSSGLAYTNYNDLNDFGPHAWAEVYFPGYGWVPYDITYNEYGFVDATHLVLKESNDADATSITYQWKGRGTEISTTPLDFKTEIIEVGEKVKPFVDLSVRALHDTNGFGSYNIFEIEVLNLNPYYVSTHLSIASSPEVEIIDSDEMDIALRPYETKRLYKRFKVNDLEEGYVYTLPLAVYSTRNSSAETSVEAAEDEPVYSQEDIDFLKNSFEKDIGGDVVRSVSVECKPSKKEYYTYEDVHLGCSVKNNGNTLVEGQLCAQSVCEAFRLGITKSVEIDLEYKENMPGKKDVLVKAEGSEIVKVQYDVLEDPVIDVVNVEHPDSVVYGEEYDVSFLLDVEGVAYDVRILIDKGRQVQEWEIEELDTNQETAITLNSKILDEGENIHKVKVQWKDRNGKEYESVKDFNVQVGEVNLLQKILMFINHILYR